MPAHWGGRSSMTCLHPVLRGFHRGELGGHEAGQAAGGLGERGEASVEGLEGWSGLTDLEQQRQDARL